MKTNKIKISLMIICLVGILVVLCGCEYKTGNRITAGEDVQTFTYAYINLGGTEIDKGCVTQWRDYDNSDTIQVLMNGKYYLTHYINVVLIADPSQGSLSFSDPTIIFGTNE